MQNVDQPTPGEFENRSSRRDDEFSPERRIERPADLEDDVGLEESESMTPDEIVAAEAARPDLSDETSDGLDDMDEEIRHQAEDLPLDERGRE